MENKIDAHTLNVLQQVLRTLTLSVATAAKADLHVLAKMLMASTANAQLATEAALMLKDLAEGLGNIAAEVQPKASSATH